MDAVVQKEKQLIQTQLSNNIERKAKVNHDISSIRSSLATSQPNLPAITPPPNFVGPATRNNALLDLLHTTINGHNRQSSLGMRLGECSGASDSQ
jgi:hypothetical protein